MDTNRSPMAARRASSDRLREEDRQGVPSGKRETGSRPLDSNVILISAKNGLLIASFRPNLSLRNNG